MSHRRGPSKATICIEAGLEPPVMGWARQLQDDRPLGAVTRSLSRSLSLRRTTVPLSHHPPQPPPSPPARLPVSPARCDRPPLTALSPASPCCSAYDLARLAPQPLLPPARPTDEQCVLDLVYNCANNIETLLLCPIHTPLREVPARKSPPPSSFGTRHFSRAVPFPADQTITLTLPARKSPLAHIPTPINHVLGAAAFYRGAAGWRCRRRTRRCDSI